MTWIRTYRGGTYDYALPFGNTISTEDVVHSLAMQCRFAGHTKRFYSVAEHSILVMLRIMQLAPDDVQAHWCGLGHDFAEALTQDLVAPLKRMPDLKGYRDIQRRVEAAVGEKFSLGWDMRRSQLVRQADLEILALEKRHSLHPCPQDEDIEPPSGLPIHFYSPDDAEDRLMYWVTRISGQLEITLP